MINKLIKISVCIITGVQLISCSTQAPKKTEVKELVKLWYMQQSTGDGAGRWEVEGVTVLSIDKDANRKNVFNTASLVSGTHHPPAIAEPSPPVKFSDTLRMNLEWNGAKWVTTTE